MTGQFPIRVLPIVLIACALFMRLLVPGGYMPVASSDGMIRIAVCSGVKASTASEAIWLDRDGTIHTEEPDGNDDGVSHPCDFTAVGAALAPKAPIVRADMMAITVAEPRFTAHHIAIGRGLAAPPPPQTGPPLLI